MNEVNDLWSPFKQLQRNVESFLLPSTQENNIAKFESILRKGRPFLATILSNPPKNEGSRKEIQQGITNGITIPGLGQTTLSRDLVDETIILSDMFNLNEFVSLELLTTAQQQMPQYPGLPRGLVAILLYYDGRKAIVSALKDLMQARLGVSWCTDASSDVTMLVTNYTDSLVNEGILKRIIDCLENLDITKELDLLTKNRALGPAKHHRMVLDLYEEVRLNLAKTLFNYSAQSGLPRDVTISLIRFLRKCKATGPRGEVGNVTTTLMMTLLYALDISVIHKREDGEDIVRRLPIISDGGFIEEIIQELLVNDETGETWECAGLRSLAVMALGLVCGTLRMAPQSLYPNAHRFIDKDEELVDYAIHMKIFEFVNHTFLENSIIFRTEFFYRRLHIVFTDFIEIMHSKVTELRARADETARTVSSFQQQGLEPPNNVDNNFANLLYSIGKFYENDEELNLQLSIEYWGPMESINGSHHRTSSRSVCLFKFMRLAGELLPQTLFIPYLKMLSGLSGNPQSARNAFNLLKQGNGAAGHATVSWEHFFNSLARYYQSLRNEQQPAIDTVYRSRARNISPQEIAGIHSVLQVIRTIATHDEVARIALCEQPNYAPIPVMLGLVSCSIVVQLKANLIMTLAALGKSSETAIQLWNLLETSQIINTVPTTSNFASRGIESELEEIESRNETYPLTRAILDLLYSLSCVIVPKSLGAGPRKPGLDPYINFVIETVFLKFYNRNYKDPQEKWEVAEKCLQICEMFMKMYNVTPKDFPSPTTHREENAQPGFHIMLLLHTKSEFLRLILHLVDEACLMLETYSPFPGKKNMENLTLQAVNILEMALSKQEQFFEAHFASNSSLLLSGLNKLILDINPRSGRNDHMLNIARLVTFNSSLPQQALAAVKILRHVIRQPNVNNQILGVFTSNDRLKLEIRQGFVECLENDGEESVEIELKEEILVLLSDSLPQAAPNLAHYLIGFDISKDIRMSNLQQPGILDFPSNCARSLIMMLDQNLEILKRSQVPPENTQKLIENAYGLLYQLCYNIKTSEVFLRYLRSCGDFLARHTAELPFFNSQKSFHVLNQMTGLLKCVAIELKLTAEKNQLSQFGNLSRILLGVAQNVTNTPETFQIELAHYGNVQKKTNKKLLICELLSCLEFEHKPTDSPKFEYFDSSLMTELFKSCETSSNSAGVKLIDVKKIHAILKEELNSVQSTIAAGQRQFIIQEIESIMEHALNLNHSKLSTSANVKFLDAWSQVTEITFSVHPTFFFTPDSRQALITEILQALLKYVVPGQVSQVVPELANSASSTVLLLMMNLRTCFGKKSPNEPSSSNFFGNQSSLNLSQDQITVSSPKSNLKYIFKNIIEWIIVSGVGSQKLRMNLYSALLNFIYIVKGNKNKDKITLEEPKEDFYVSRLDRTIMKRNQDFDIDDEISSQKEMAVEVLQSFGDNLIDILCHDCTGGHDVVKMLSLACIDLLLDIDNMTQFINFISTRGYLAHIIDSLLKTDQKLCRVLDHQPENLKALYVYESQISMLSRFASSYIGAELLLEHRVIGVLSQMKVFDLHPDFQINNFMATSNSFIPPVDVRYQQILFPALSLCDVILITLGPENQSVITQITHFLLSHSDVIEIVLRAGTPGMNLGLLKELSAITGLIARVANQNISELIDPSGNHDVGAHLYRLQKLMMTLFSRFIVTDLNLKDIQRPGVVQQHESEEVVEKQKLERRKLFLQIAVNISLFARNAIANHTVDHRTTKVLFSVSGDSFHGINESVVMIETSPSLSVVVSQLKNCVEFYNREKVAYDGMIRQRNALPGISLDVNVMQNHQQLTEKLIAKSQELKLSVFIVEHCMYLLWAHLDYYLLRAITPALQFNGFMSSGDSAFAASRATSDEIAKLKQNLVTVFNETFSKQLLSTSQDQNNTEKGFIDALLRRIKRLIQFVPVE